MEKQSIVDKKVELEKSVAPSAVIFCACGIPVTLDLSKGPFCVELTCPDETCGRQFVLRYNGEPRRRPRLELAKASLDGDD